MKPIEIYEQSRYSDQMTILAYVIDQCNYDCPYCYNKRPRNYYKLNLDRLMIFCKHIHNKTKRKIKLELIGGEPTLHPDLLKFCKDIQVLDFINCFILTNFSQSLNYYNQLFDVGVIFTATWHGTKNDQMNNDFIDKILNVDKKFICNKQLEIRIMFEHDNFQNAKHAFNIFCLNGLKDFIQSGLISVGEYDKHLYTNEQLKEYSSIAQQIDNDRKLYHVKYDDNTISNLKFNELFLNDEFSFMNWICNAGQTYLYVHSNGDIYPCETYFYDIKDCKIGNIFNFKDLTLKKTLCRCKFCTSCDFGIHKKKVFS